ncbi:MAG: YihY/virulence factor BrkB family protein [Caulobacteraceae bacterium]|nr:YihY/virulence factor BrkB family protein [Caulobacteraceae bacterium]
MPAQRGLRGLVGGFLRQDKPPRAVELAAPPITPAAAEPPFPDKNPGAQTKAHALLDSFDPGHSIRSRWIDGDVTGVLIACAFLAGGLALETISTMRAAGAPAVSAPADIPPRRWPAILKAAFLACLRDRIPAVAAGVGFYGILSLFPAMAAFVSFYGLFGDVDKAQNVLSLLNGLAPPETLQFFGDEMVRIAAGHQAQLSTTFAIGLLVSLWSANAAMNALLGGLNVAYERQETRNFFRLNLTSLTFTVGAIGLALVASAAIIAGAAAERLGLSQALLFEGLRWPGLLAAVIGVLAVLYRYGPDRPDAHWRWVSPGSLFAALAWLAASFAFSFYVDRFGHYDRTYGPLAALVGFMVWFWLTVIITLFGAELNNEAKHAAA